MTPHYGQGRGRAPDSGMCERWWTGGSAVRLQVRLLCSSTKSYKSGSTIAIMLAIVDAAGTNRSAVGLPLTITGDQSVSGRVRADGAEVHVRGMGSCPNDSLACSRYIYQLKTNGFRKGTYNLLFTVGGTSPCTKRR